MKGVYWLVAMILALTPALALDISINDEPLEGVIELTSGEEFEVNLKDPHGAIILDVKIKSDSIIVEQAIELQLQEYEYSTIKDETETLLLPPEIPATTAVIKVKILYSDSKLERHKLEREFTMKIEEGEDASAFAKWAKSLPEDAQMVLFNHFTDYEVPRISTALRPEDLDADDLKALGMSVSEFMRNPPEIKLINDGETEAKLIPGYDAEGPVRPEVTIAKYVYEISHGGKTITKSKVIVSCHANDNFLTSGEMIIEVPKEIAKSAGLLDLSDFPMVIEDDPVLKWNLKNVPQNQVKDYSYTVDGDVQNFETLAEAASEKPSLIAKILMIFFGGKS